MTTSRFDCQSCQLRKLECFHAISKEALTFLSEFRLGELRVDAGSEILSQASDATHFYTLYKGWTARRITLDDGRSQITNFALPGALLGIQAALDRDMDHSIEALTDVVLCVFPRSGFRNLLEKQPELTYRAVWQVAREEHFLGANITAVGRKQAHEKIAYLFASLHQRAVLSGMASPGAPLDAPITQQHVADAMGLSIAHTHRVMRDFAAKQLIAPNRKKIRLLEPDRLAEIGEFDREAMMPMALV